jgi:hypothetical protein
MRMVIPVGPHYSYQVRDLYMRYACACVCTEHSSAWCHTAVGPFYLYQVQVVGGKTRCYSVI